MLSKYVKSIMATNASMSLGIDYRYVSMLQICWIYPQNKSCSSLVASSVYKDFERQG